MTGLFVEMNNRLISLSDNFYMRIVTKSQREVEHASNGLTLETIIRCDEAIKEWWATTPTCLRLCNDLYTDNLQLLNDTDWIKGVIICFAHMLSNYEDMPSSRFYRLPELQYPLPGYALFVDILDTSCAHLQSTP
ncbi:hypothetical protein BDB00DRAFT_936139 [Zychaea mexicana]|uniref:uncharacterized protein n=1 Tax=Zychaea mexicana TaxID=64656 RepID=UPI0022FDE5FA|nr:uncharacterized protein BDB00DRAFT_936139 [Zychaea mexicana]KAI9497698.1 hypothetical protein BDB00DRAFT_936139 [Zychaea mexicana]